MNDIRKNYLVFFANIKNWKKLEYSQTNAKLKLVINLGV